jgi:hypothetical protein
MHQRQGRLSGKAGPDLFFENPNDLRLVRQRVKQVLDKAQSDPPILVNEFERRYVRRIDTHLAVTDDAVAGILETGNAKFCDAHTGIPCT